MLCKCALLFPSVFIFNPEKIYIYSFIIFIFSTRHSFVLPLCFQTILLFLSFWATFGGAPTEAQSPVLAQGFHHQASKQLSALLLGFWVQSTYLSALHTCSKHHLLFNRTWKLYHNGHRLLVGIGLVLNILYKWFHWVDINTPFVRGYFPWNRFGNSNLARDAQAVLGRAVIPNLSDLKVHPTNRSALRAPNAPPRPLNRPVTTPDCQAVLLPVFLDPYGISPPPESVGWIRGE